MPQLGRDKFEVRNDIDNLAKCESILINEYTLLKFGNYLSEFGLMGLANAISEVGEKIAALKGELDGN